MRGLWAGVLTAAGTAMAITWAAAVQAQAPSLDKPEQPERGSPVPLRAKTSYIPVAIEESFEEIHKKGLAAKAKATPRHRALLEERYDLSNRPVKGVTMTRGKPVQGGVRVKLPSGVSWEQLAQMKPEDIKRRGLWPKGFLPLPHPNHEEGGMLFPAFHIKEIQKQEARDLTRFDLDFDLADHFLPEFPPAIFLTTRPDLGDVSRGELVTNQNFFRLFDGVLTPKQLNGLRLLVSPFAQQQFNLTSDRRSLKPSMGVTCFDCHVNGHTNAATHLVGDIRPQPFRKRIDTPSLRGVSQQRLFGSQRALKTVEDFTEFEQRAAYFDGDPVVAMKKGVNTLDRPSQVHDMAEFQELLDFPPAPKLDVFGRLIPGLATQQELRGEKVFFGKGRCAECHAPPIFSDNFMHDLKVERFYEPVLINGRMASRDGPIKTFPLRGIKESPPYLHDDRLLTLDDTVEYFNLVLGLRLTPQEKQDLVAYMYTL
ncbi:cytochrome B6 [Myxococcus sp. RHSTA-1-4]|uniref:cytochrome B6 n=1 Tax=Myxococcus sp. RHSTA-1-4 TaxID=2874601 RepID=UPI001CC10F17|nr:cytochrome B6 [Myxococcus sp. RHSTA-1-4]MBZ4418007.1 cytochrome B6 [Myxococcus sp. RHSTA-1-4]